MWLVKHVLFFLCYYTYHPHLKFLTTSSNSIFLSGTENHLDSITFFWCVIYLMPNSFIRIQAPWGRGFVCLWFGLCFQCL